MKLNFEKAAAAGTRVIGLVEECMCACPRQSWVHAKEGIVLKQLILRSLILKRVQHNREREGKENFWKAKLHASSYIGISSDKNISSSIALVQWIRFHSSATYDWYHQDWNVNCSPFIVSVRIAKCSLKTPMESCTTVSAVPSGRRVRHLFFNGLCIHGRTSN